MKKSNRLLFWCLCSAILLTSCHHTLGNRDSASYPTVKSSGVMVNRSITVSDYKSIDVSNGICLTLTDGAKNTVLVEMDEAYYKYLDIDVSGGVLNISMKPMKFASNKGNTINVSVSARGVSNFNASTAASIKAETTLVGNELTFDLSTASQFSGEVACKKVTADLSSASRIDISGATDYLEVDISSGASINADKLIAKKVVCDASSGSSANVHAVEATIDASSGSSVRVYAIEELTVDASSGSYVGYDGDAKIVRINTSSGARVSKNNN